MYRIRARFVAFPFVVALVLACALTAVVTPAKAEAAPSFPATIDTTTFPDPNWRQYVIDTYAGGTTTLTQVQADAVTSMHLKLAGLSAANLQGIEYFQNLTDLNCDGIGIQGALDLSGNPALRTLNCQNNFALTSINLSNNPALVDLYCYNTQLTLLDVSGNPALVTLLCTNIQVTSLDLSNNPALVTLFCYDTKLTSLDVSSNPMLEYLDCSNTQLTSLDVSNNLVLELIYCENTQLVSLDVSGSPALKFLDCSGASIIEPIVGLTPGQLIFGYSFLNQSSTIPLSHDGLGGYVSDSSYALSAPSFTQSGISFDTGSNTVQMTSFNPSTFFTAFSGYNNGTTDINLGGTLSFYIPEYTLTFANWDGAVIDSQQIESGLGGVAPADPTRTSYEFAGWDTSFTIIKSDTVTTALFDPIVPPEPTPDPQPVPTPDTTTPTQPASSALAATGDNGEAFAIGALASCVVAAAGLVVLRRRSLDLRD